MDNIFIGFGVTALVGHIPTKRLEKRIDKFLAKPELLVGGRSIVVSIIAVAIYKFFYDCWNHPTAPESQLAEHTVEQDYRLGLRLQ